MAQNHHNGASPQHAERNAARTSERSNPGADAIQAWLVGKLSEQLGIEARELDVAEPFASYGLGSTELVGLSGELAQWLGRQLPAELAYECPTIETLARRLAEPADVTHSALPAGTAHTAATEAIAIIGIGCRFPGADDADAFWQLLRNGVDAIREVPPERFNVADFFDPDPSAPGKMVTRWGGFIEQVDKFDAHFFGISPREAARMDPQQRLLLEVASQALEDAGQPREHLAGTAVGIFIGISNNDYGRIQLSDFNRIDAYAGTGNALSIAANRISYVFDFHGPSMAIDTACSSSLVAVHEACASLRRGESTLALAGGVNLVLSPAVTINFSKAGAMAPDGRCKTFDAGANGYVRGEGAGIVVLKPLTRALADGDPIYAVIRGSAINQDGRSNGLMAPNPRAQEAVLREAYRRAEVAPADVQYVEAHGTGTLLGDPIEAKALGTVLAVNRAPGLLCAVGSVKTNIGHLEAAAGIAGLIKVALALKHREIPPSLHFEEPNPHIPFDQLPLRVQTSLAAWPAAPAAALGGVSSFGFGGTNAHVVMQEAPASDVHLNERQGESLRSTLRVDNSAHLLPLSARSPEALRSVATAYRDFLMRADSAASISDICHSASLRRSHHEYRLAVVGASTAQLAESLDAYLRGEMRPELASGQRHSDRRRKVVFVFPGQGSQWLGMGRALIDREPVFRDAIERCDRAMRPYGDWSVLVELAAPADAPSRLHEIDLLQPALFAIQVALAALWHSWGIDPDAVVGHSMGEVAAAYVAGALTLDDAARVICTRSRLVKRTVGRGAMAAVELSLDDLRPVLAGYADRVSIAASNSHAATVLSGDPAALDAIVARLRTRDIFCRTLKVDFAAHSPQMDPLRDELMLALDCLNPHAPTVPLYSTVTGEPTASGGQSGTNLPIVADQLSAIGSGTAALALDARYWARNLRDPVLFAAAIDRLLDDGHDLFLEISPHPILLSAIQQGLDHARKSGVVLPSMRREEDQPTAMLTSLGALYACGQPVDWSRLYPAGGHYVSLPFYPWQRERCWLDAAPLDRANASQAHPPALDGAGSHPLLGWHFKSPHPADTHFWEVTLDRTTRPYLDDHRVAGVTVIPAALYLEMAWAAALTVLGTDSLVLTDIEFHTALFLPDGAAPTLQLAFTTAADGRASFHVYSCPTDAPHSAEDARQSATRWTLHASGNVAKGNGVGSETNGAGFRVNITNPIGTVRKATGTGPNATVPHVSGTYPSGTVTHATGTASLSPGVLPPATPLTPTTPETPDEIQRRCSDHISGPDYYARLRENGIDYGPFYQRIANLWRRDTEVLAALRPFASSDSPAPDGYPLHPAILDACIQGAGAALPEKAGHDHDHALYMPTGIAELRINGGAGALKAGTHAQESPPLWTHAQLSDLNADTIEGGVRLLDTSGHAAIEISGLRLRNLARGTGGNAHDLHDLNDCLYQFQWQASERRARPSSAEPAAPAASGNWLIFADNGGVGAALAAVVNAAADAARAIVVTRGDSYQRLDDAHYRIHPERPGDLQRLLAAVTAPGEPACRVAVHLWSLDSDPSAQATATSLEAAQTLGCASVLQLLQELVRAERDSPRLWLITRGAQPAGEARLSIDPAQAPLWGLGRVIAQEHPTHWGGLIDLAPRAEREDTEEAAANDAPTKKVTDGLAHTAELTADNEGAVRQLFEEIAGPDGEDQLAFRDGRRYVGRLTRKPRSVARETPLTWYADGTYLITGGLGDLGLSVARWMVAQGARRLLLMGRTVLPERAHWNSVEAGSRLAHQIAAIRALEASGASVHLAAVDVADEPQMRAFLDRFRAEGWPQIRGVVHAAGVLHDAMLTQLDTAALASVLRPKMIGSWLLHRLLHNAPLDFFVLFSSAGSLLGQPGQGNYAAANAFLDALAHHRRALGQTALTINWGAWSGLGFAESAGGKRLAARLALIGIESLAPQDALALMGQLLRDGATQVAAVPVNWARYREFYLAGSASALLSDLAREAAGDAVSATSHTSEKRDAILAAEPAERRRLLQMHLADLVARVLGLSASKLDLQQPLSNLGLDSLMAVELKNRIAVDLGVNVPMVTFLSGPSVEQASDQLLQLLATGTSVSSISPSPAAAPPANDDYRNDSTLENLDRYSDEEVNSLLADLIEKEALGE